MRNSHNDKLAVSLTKCFFCNKDDKIVLNKTLTERHAKNVESMHGMIIDMDPCNECKDFMKQGLIVITIDPSRSEPDWNKERIPNPYRTGGWFVVKDRVADIFDDKMKAWVLKHRWMFMEDEAARKMGLFEVASKKDK